MDYNAYQAFLEEKDRQRRLTRPLRQNANAIFFGMSLVILLGLFLNYPLQMFVRVMLEHLAPNSPAFGSALRLLADILVAGLMLIIPMMIIRFWVNIPPWAAFPLRIPKASMLSPAIFACLGASAAGSLAYGLISLLMNALFGVALGTPAYAPPVGELSTALYLLRIVLLPSVLEELFFRGVILQSLRRFGDAFALVCSSVIFGFAHLNAAQGVSAFFIGLAIGFFVLRTGSILTGIILHFVNNALVVAAEFLTHDMSLRAADLFSRLQFALYVFFGFLGLVWLLVTCGSRIFSLAPPRYSLKPSAKALTFFVAPCAIIYYGLLAVYAALNILWR